MKESLVVVVDCLLLNLKQSNMKILRASAPVFFYPSCKSSYSLDKRRTLVVLYPVRLEDAPCSRKHKVDIICDCTNPVASGKAMFQLLIIEVNIGWLVYST